MARSRVCLAEVMCIERGSDGKNTDGHGGSRGGSSSEGKSRKSVRTQSKKSEAKQPDEAHLAPSDSMPEEHMLPVGYQPASAFEMAAQPGFEAGKTTELFSPAILWDSKPALPVISYLPFMQLPN